MRAVLMIVLAGLTVGCGKKEDGGGGGGAPDKAVPAKSVPEDWTHKELTEHLNKNGAKLRVIPVGTSVSGPWVILADQDSKITEDEAHVALDAKPPTVVSCVLRKTPQEAKEAAGAAGDGAFASGRFVFRGSPEILKRIRAALP